jgi:hypothetical protein
VWKSGFAVSALLCTLLQAQLPPGRIETRKNQDEKETGQAGGQKWGVYQTVNDLRCEKSGEALVGVKTSRGTVLDKVQILCAPVTCSGSNCSWRNAYWAGSAGNLAGGHDLAPMVCKTNQAVSGYRATLRGGNMFDYVNDLSIECGTITGPSRGHLHNTFPIGEPRTYLHPEGHLDTSRGTLAGPFNCERFSATALSTATGKFQGLARVPVVQAVSLYCGWPGAETNKENNPCPPRSLYIGNNSAGQPICQACVAASSQWSGVTAPVDRSLATLPVERFNCHYYTLTFLNAMAGRTIRMPKLYGAVGEAVEMPFSQECMQDSDFAAAGYRQVQNGRVDPANLRPGDVVTVLETTINRMQCAFSHSGVVISGGATPMIRQKPNLYDCIVDYSFHNFQALYITGARTIVWRRTSTGTVR